MSRNELVKDVCVELSDYYCNDGVYSHTLGDNVDPFDVIAERVLNAHNREMAEKDAEIVRLRAALKPVLECKSYDFDVAGFSGDYEGYVFTDAKFVDKMTGLVELDDKRTNDVDTAADCCNAVREAQRIYNESEAV